MKSIIFSVLMLFVSLSTFSQTVFEGEINYRSFENHSKMVRKFSKGMNYNGARNVKVIIKGNKMNILDESLHLNVLLLPDEDCCIIYNDLLKKGLKCSFSNYTLSYMSSFGPKCINSTQTKEYSFEPTGETGTFTGEKCKRYKGLTKLIVSNMEPSTVTSDVWCATKYKVDPIYQYYLNGLGVPGIAMKWTISSHAKVPIIGKMDTFVATEVKSIIPRKVDDSEMQIPSDYELKETDSAFKMLKIYGETKKYLKANNMYPADAESDTEVTYQIEESWDF